MKWVVCLTHLAKLYKESRKKRCSSLLSGKYEKGGNYYRHAADTTEQPPFFWLSNSRLGLTTRLRDDVVDTTSFALLRLLSPRWRL